MAGRRERAASGRQHGRHAAHGWCRWQTARAARARPRARPRAVAGLGWAVRAARAGRARPRARLGRGGRARPGRNWTPLVGRRGPPQRIWAVQAARHSLRDQQGRAQFHHRCCAMRVTRGDFMHLLAKNTSVARSREAIHCIIVVQLTSVVTQWHQINGWLIEQLSC